MAEAENENFSTNEPLRTSGNFGGEQSVRTSGHFGGYE
jgi:hypothetical protein